jgi:glutamate-1-semialdehyde 2,1-aminomutase
MEFKDRISRKKSAELFEEAKTYFPGGVNSPVRAFKSVTGPPIFIRKGDRSRIWDEDDNQYLDFCASWGPLILGHNHPKIRKAIIKTVKKGTGFGTPNKLGNKIGKLLIENHRYLEMVRFVSSGTEAVMSAIRLARGYTNKTKIIKFEGCYHGHVDSLMVKAGSGLVTLGVSTSAGIPESFISETIVLPLNDLYGFEKTMAEFHHEIACVIIEPVPANNGLLIQDQSYLSWLRKICDDYGVLLILDEVISGFRVGFEGASGHYAIEPDLITFGKIIGGGLPVGAYGGKKEIMKMVAPEGNVYQAGTLAANPVSLAAGIATLKVLLQEGFYENLELKTQKFVQLIQSHCDINKYKIKIHHMGSIFWIPFTNERVFSSDQIDPKSMDKFKILHHELLQRGIYFGPSGYEVGFISDAHTDEELAWAAGQINEVLDIIHNQ